MSAAVTRTKDERERGYLEARLVVRETQIREALQLLQRNTYEGMQHARLLLERAVYTMNDGEP